MAEEQIIKVPDIGGATGVDVIEIMVKAGDEIAIDTPLITLESDKASMDIPSPQAGKVSHLAVKIGDKLSEGDVILTLETKAEESKQKETEPSAPKEPKKIEEENKEEQKAPELKEKSNKKPSINSETLEVRIPDIGGATDVDVIEVMVQEGQEIEKDQSLITLEGDKATMDIPSPAKGTIKQIKINLGAKVSQGDLVLIMQAEETEDLKQRPAQIAEESKTSEIQEAEPEAEQTAAPEASRSSSDSTLPGSPAIRRMARELGVNLAEVKGTGRKSRVTKEDLQNYIKTKLNDKSVSGFNVPSQPRVDFSKFGEIEIKPLNKIKRLTGVNVHRSWIMIPHVTQFDEADITELEEFRTIEASNATHLGYKLTLLAFVTKIVAKALTIYPQFNSSLDESGENLIYKKYCHLGIAVETGNGLVVPVIKNVDQLTVSEIAMEMARLSSKAREKGLTPGEMSGGCFTISSLGGIGGTAFTPIVNSPEVAILGLSRSKMKPIYIEGEFKPRLMLPLSLSYDHRVIDGAEAARFTRFISESLTDIRRILL